MDWIVAHVSTNQWGIEPVGAALMEAGFKNLEIIEDIEDVRAFLKDTEKYWDYVDYDELKKRMGEPAVRVYLMDNEIGRAQLNKVIAAIEALKKMDLGFSVGTLDVSTFRVDEEDWANSWKRFFVPIEIGDRVLICPAWETPPKTDRVIFKIESSSLFGTGNHESTQLCLQLLQQVVKAGDSVLDIGCGSGILGIVALQLGAKSTLAVEIEPNAPAVVGENVALNGIDPGSISVLVGDVLKDTKLQNAMQEAGYDVVLANIVADVIIELAPTALAKVKPGGHFICSGIIEGRLEDVLSALKQNGFSIVQTLTQGSWAAILAGR